jgi:hypothetical protein
MWVRVPLAALMINNLDLQPIKDLFNNIFFTIAVSAVLIIIFSIVHANERFAHYGLVLFLYSISAGFLRVFMNEMFEVAVNKKQSLFIGWSAQFGLFICLLFLIFRISQSPL